MRFEYEIFLFEFLKRSKERYFTENRTHDWLSVLQDITRNINNTVNRSIGMPPSKVTPDKANLIRERLFAPTDKVDPCKLEIGDNVRIPRIKNIHSKGYTQSKLDVKRHFLMTLFLDWTNSIYQIVKVERSFDVCYYRLKNSGGEQLDRTFYADELNFVSKPD